VQINRAALRAIRESQGLSVPALAELAGMTRFGLHDIENRGRNPREGTVKKLADALGVPVSAISDLGAVGAVEDPQRGRP
jgi:transcriptional regulator with XRE-family HTH domain